MADLTYRKAVIDELDSVCEVIEDGRATLAALGIDQWQGGTPNRGMLRADIEAGNCRVAVDGGGVICGTLAFVVGIEHDYEYSVNCGQWLTDALAEGAKGYATLHRVATRAAGKRKGIATFMFQEALREAEGLGLASVRVDTHAGNGPMQNLMTKLGYSRTVEITLTNTAEPTLLRIGYERLV